MYSQKGMEEMAFKSIHYQRISSEEEILDEDLPPTVVSTRTDERGLLILDVWTIDFFYMTC